MSMLPSLAVRVAPADVKLLGAWPAMASSVLSMMLRAMETPTVVALELPAVVEKLMASLTTGETTVEVIVD